MPVKRTTATVLLVLTAVAIAAIPAASALAVESAGGASAPSASPTSTPSTAKVRPTGIATWFGPGFYGKRTACGQTLTPGVIGVANRTLPCGTLVKVTYTDHTITLPVLDRGPYSHIGADWDLTAGAAHALGIKDTVRIRARVVGRAANNAALGAPAAAPTALVAGGASAG
jgi:rare lipoprotein A